MNQFMSSTALTATARIWRLCKVCACVDIYALQVDEEAVWYVCRICVLVSNMSRAISRRVLKYTAGAVLSSQLDVDVCRVCSVENVCLGCAERFKPKLSSMCTLRRSVSIRYGMLLQCVSSGGVEYFVSNLCGA